MKEYTGVDLSRKKGSKSIDTIGQEVSDVQSLGFRLPQQSSTSDPKADHGMSRKEDQDLYANRSSK